MSRPSKRSKPRLPRAPLPRQTGGAHKVKTKVLHRKRKHKKDDPEVDGVIAGIISLMRSHGYGEE